jgi:F-type H+-transporting ATPase subunit gamma
MKRAIMVAEEVDQIGVVGDLASVFEGIASMRIAKIKDRVVSSKAFFGELWHIYTQLRTDSGEQLTVSQVRHSKDVFLVVTSEGGLSGDIDGKIIERVLKEYQASSTDIVVLGSHGALLLAQAGVQAVRGYKLPDTEVALDVSPIVTELEKYRQAAVFYQTYESLGVQSVARIDLISAVEAQGQENKGKGETISSKDYIFEPSLGEIVHYMKSVVMGLTLSQVILESRLAQLASRFNAMSTAKQRAHDLRDELTLNYRRAKRSEADARLREVITSLRGLA